MDCQRWGGKAERTRLSLKEFGRKIENEETEKSEESPIERESNDKRVKVK